MRRVLIVDDDQAIVNLLVELIAGEGHEAYSVSNEEAVATARTWQPDVVLLDLMMPAPDGFAIAGALEVDPTTRAIPIIAMSAAYPASRVQDRIRASRFLPKPFDILEVLRLIEEVGAEAKPEAEPRHAPLPSPQTLNEPATTIDRGI